MIQKLKSLEAPSPEEVLPFYEQAIATGDKELLKEVDRICGECFSIDAEDLPSICE